MRAGVVNLYSTIWNSCWPITPQTLANAVAASIRHHGRSRHLLQLRNRKNCLSARFRVIPESRFSTGLVNEAMRAYLSRKSGIVAKLTKTPRAESQRLSGHELLETVPDVRIARSVLDICSILCDR
jgi:hypothetical protein